MLVMDGLIVSKNLFVRVDFNMLIIVISVNVMKDDIEISVKVGISDYIVKLINFVELEKVFVKWLFQ